MPFFSSDKNVCKNTENEKPQICWKMYQTAPNRLTKFQTARTPVCWGLGSDPMKTKKNKRESDYIMNQKRMRMKKETKQEE